MSKASQRFQVLMSRIVQSFRSLTNNSSSLTRDEENMGQVNAMFLYPHRYASRRDTCTFNKEILHRTQSNDSAYSHDAITPRTDTTFIYDLPDDDQHENGHTQKAENNKRRKSLYQVYQMIKGKDPENEVDDLEVQVARYKPESLDSLCKTTKFTKKELQIMYRGFKQECPSGIVNEDTFKQIYGQFFPQGDSNAYAHFVFNAFDKDKNGSISFDEFVRALSMLCRGSMEEKLHWAFSLYDINGDGVVTKEEFTEVVSAIYDMMGKSTDPAVDESTVQEHVNNIYQSVDDINTPLTEEEFINLCYRDHFLLKSSFLVFDTDLRINDQPQVVEP